MHSTEKNLPASSVILELKAVSKSFWPDVLKPRQQALKNINLPFQRGVCSGLLGHNGAGKTTTIKAIFQLLVPDRGEILYKGKPIKKSDYYQFGYMPEVNKLPGNLTVQQAISDHLALLNRKLNSKQAAALIKSNLELVSLWEHRDKKINQLSKGMARRAAWVMATIHNPEVLVLDEPFSGLDPWGRIEMESWILERKRSGISIILCTHEIWAIESICDQIFILNQGQVVYPSKEHSNLDLYAMMESLNKFNLKISGAVEEDVKTLQQQQQLPIWHSMELTGYLITLSFNDYDEAVRWMTACSQKQWIIVQFEQRRTFKTSELLTFFKIKAI